MSSPNPTPRWQVAAVVTFYMASALCMVFVNKAVLTSTPALPLTFLLVQLSLAVLFLHISALFSPKIKEGVPKVSQVPRLAREKWTGLWKVVAVNGIGLVFNTLCLRDVDASFFQIARGLVLPLTILVSAFVIRSRPSYRVLLPAACVTVGFLLGVAPSLNPTMIHDPAIYLTSLTKLSSKIYASPLSLFYGVLSSVFIALHAVFIKSSLPVVNNSAIALAWWSNAGGVLMLLPMAILNGEATVLMNMASNGDFGKVEGTTFLVGSLTTGFVGFLLCIAGLLSIKITSPITHMFSSAARSVLQTILGVCIFGDILTVNRAASISVILIGTMWYTWTKSQEAYHAPANRPQSIDLEASGTKGRFRDDGGFSPTRLSPTSDTEWELKEKERN